MTAFSDNKPIAGNILSLRVSNLWAKQMLTHTAFLKRQFGKLLNEQL